ncbi:MAG: DUF1080 domain-containing protein [Phycisphaerales bacterium]|nr:DUF1080 domain-containing protein [Phycisphaerales bacterium]
MMSSPFIATILACAITPGTSAPPGDAASTPVPGQSAQPVTKPVAYRVETRRNGVLLTFDQPVAPNVSAGTARFTVLTSTGQPIAIQNTIMSPDGRRVFLETAPAPAESTLVVKTNLGQETAAKGSPPHRDAAGPDFAASTMAIDPALSRKAPDNAIILFDGTDTSNLVMRKSGKPITWTVSGDVLISKKGHGDVLSAQPLSDGLYHIEWLSPPGGRASTQQNGNSGVKFEERYELQILNNDGAPREPLFNESGGIYRFRAADVNASLGAGKWQTFHAWYTAPRWDGEKKIADARLTVYWNDVLVHDDVAIPAKTGASLEEGPDPKRLLLQDHAYSEEDEVRFRNVWHVPARSLTADRQPPGTDAPGQHP